MTLVGHPEVIAEPWFASGRERAEHAELLDSYVGWWIAARTRDEVIRAFERVGAAAAPVYSARDLVEDPHVRGHRDARGSRTTSSAPCSCTT